MRVYYDRDADVGLIKSKTIAVIGFDIVMVLTPDEHQADHYRSLLEPNMRPGDRVDLHMPNLPELIVAYYVCFSTGAIAAPLNNRLKSAELEQISQRLQPVFTLARHIFTLLLRPSIANPFAERLLYRWRCR